MRQSNARVAIALIGAAAACSSRGKSGAEGGRSRDQAAPPVAASAGAPTGSLPAPSPSVATVTAPRTGAGARAPEGQAEPVDAPRPPPSVACYAGFAPSGVPRVDVVRLGVACGPSSGLTQLARTNGVVDDAGGGPTLRWDADRGDCFRLFAVAGEPVEDLEVEVKGPHGSSASLTNQNRRWLVVGEDGFFCAEQKGQFEAAFTTHAGHGVLAAAVWRGAHMVGKGRGL